MKTKALTAMVAAALMAMSAGLLATVTVNPDGSAFVGRGDVLNVFFTGPHAGENFDAHASEVAFSEEAVADVEQDCYTEGQSQVKVGVRTGTISTGLIGVAATLRKNSQGNVTGFDLAAPNLSLDDSDIEWNHPAGSDNQGCPNSGPEQDAHPKFSPRIVSVGLDGIWVTWNGQTVQIYP